MQERVVQATVSRSHRAEVTRSDTRWLAVWLGVFAGLMLLIIAAHQVYRATGPYPAVTAFIRQLKYHSRWLIPGMKGKRSSTLLLPIADLHLNLH
jgi:hypothetical protein